MTYDQPPTYVRGIFKMSDHYNCDVQTKEKILIRKLREKMGDEKAKCKKTTTTTKFSSPTNPPWPLIPATALKSKKYLKKKKQKTF